jgi:peptidoglycan/LPS O-acetylase OafA/YrhL
MDEVKTRIVAPVNHLPLLDLLRATAALLVLFGHTRNFTIGAVDHPSPLLKCFWLITALEHEAVVIFFVLSGFLVGGAIVNSMNKKSFDLAKYLIARFARIYIVYVPALIVTALVFWIGRSVLQDFGGDTIRPLFSESQPDLGGLRAALCHFAGVQGFLCEEWKQNPPLWSLGYEWALYLFAPAILGLVVARGAWGIRLTGVVLLLFGAAAMSGNLKEWAVWFTVWFVGVAAWRVSRAYCLPMTVGLIGLSLVIGGMAFSRLHIVIRMETDTVITAGAALAIACRPLVSFPLAPRFFGWAANFSYSLYATHLPLIFLIIAFLQNVGLPTHKILPSTLAFSEFGICVIISLMFAYAFSIFTERRTVYLRSWLSAKMLQSNQPLPAAHRRTVSENAVFNQ